MTPLERLRLIVLKIGDLELSDAVDQVLRYYSARSIDETEKHLAEVEKELKDIAAKLEDEKTAYHDLVDRYNAVDRHNVQITQTLNALRAIVWAPGPTEAAKVLLGELAMEHRHWEQETDGLGEQLHEAMTMNVFGHD